MPYPSPEKANTPSARSLMNAAGSAHSVSSDTNQTSSPFLGSTLPPADLNGSESEKCDKASSRAEITTANSSPQTVSFQQPTIEKYREVLTSLRYELPESLTEELYRTVATNSDIQIEKLPIDRSLGQDLSISSVVTYQVQGSSLVEYHTITVQDLYDEQGPQVSLVKHRLGPRAGELELQLHWTPELEVDHGENGWLTLVDLAEQEIIPPLPLELGHSETIRLSDSVFLTVVRTETIEEELSGLCAKSFEVRSRESSFPVNFQVSDSRATELELVAMTHNVPLTLEACGAFYSYLDGAEIDFESQLVCLGEEGSIYEVNSKQQIGIIAPADHGDDPACQCVRSVFFRFDYQGITTHLLLSSDAPELMAEDDEFDFSDEEVDEEDLPPSEIAIRQPGRSEEDINYAAALNLGFVQGREITQHPKQIAVVWETEGDETPERLTLRWGIIDQLTDVLGVGRVPDDLRKLSPDTNGFGWLQIGKDCSLLAACLE